MAKTLQEVLEENNIQTFESSNGRRVANCPFHEGDRHPSFTLYPNETYYCFGCRVWGNPVKFLVDYKGMSSAEAQAYVGVDYELSRKEKTRILKAKNLLKTGRFLAEVAQKYHQYLIDNAGPMWYLHSRGLTDKTIVENMIGYTDGSVLNDLSVEEMEMATEVGLMTKNGYEALANRIVIPNIFNNGHSYYCDFMVGRTVINDRNKYLGLRMAKPLMGFFKYRHSPILFMVEGQFDWLVLKQWGYPSIAVGGSTITRHNAKSLKGKYLIYIPDNDKVGLQNAERLVELFGPMNIAILSTEMFPYKDISEWAENDGYAMQHFMKLLEDTLWPILSSNPSWQKFVPQLNLLPNSVLT